MAIKRVTIEIDDTVNTQNPTELPSELKTARNFSPEEKIGTGEDISQETTLDNKPVTNIQPNISSIPNVGRTQYDLFLEIKEDNRSMIILFVIISMVIFAFKIGTIKFIEYLQYVACAIILLNITWFGFPIFKKKNK